MYTIISLNEVIFETDSEALADLLCVQLRRDGWGMPYVEVG